MIADILRAVILSGGALLGGWMIGVAIKEWRSAQHHRLVPAKTLVLPWWSALSWVLFIIAAAIPHIRAWGTIDVIIEQAILNTLAIMLGIRAIQTAYRIRREAEEDET